MKHRPAPLEGSIGAGPIKRGRREGRGHRDAMIRRRKTGEV